LKVCGLEVFAVFQDSNVTCGTFVEASSADWSQKEFAGMFLQVVLVSDAPKTDSDLQLAKTAMPSAYCDAYCLLLTA